MPSRPGQPERSSPFSGHLLTDANGIYGGKGPRHTQRKRGAKKVRRSAASGAVALTLPWSVLASVNDRVNRVGDRLRLTHTYRTRLANAEALVLHQVRGERPRFTGPVSLEARFYEPDRRRRDPSNLMKLIEDAMTEVVYADDAQICRSMWERAGVDRRDPRVEIRVAALEESQAA